MQNINIGGITVNSLKTDTSTVCKISELADSDVLYFKSVEPQMFYLKK